MVYVPQVRQRQGETFELWEHPRRPLGSGATLLLVAGVALPLVKLGYPRRRRVELWPTPLFSLSLSLSQAGFLLWKTESQRELSGTGLRSQCWKYVYVERRREWGDKGYCCKFQRRLSKCFTVAVNVPGSTNFVLLSSDSGVSSQVMFQQTDKSSSSTLSKERHFIKSNL